MSKAAMKTLSRPSKIALPILMFLLVSSACTPSGPVTDTPSSKEVTAPGEMTLGPGAFNMLDTTAGLSSLDSYKASLSLTFDGTRDGQPSQWSRTYVMLNVKEPAARQLTLERAGDLANLERVYMAEAEGAAFERRGENACFANPIEAGNTLADRLEPAGLLMPVVGADEAGVETINAAPANHYTFDARALGQSDLSQSTGELWVEAGGTRLVRYRVTTTGAADYFGAGVEGTLTWNYELTDVNQPLTVEVPADCPAGMVDAPRLPDASNVLNMPGVLSYDSASSLADAAAFHQEQIPGPDWALRGQPIITDTSALLNFVQAGRRMTVIVTPDGTGTVIHITLTRAPE